ncbi:MAG TPA: hypothetical protein VJ818_05760 [Actinomycetota bacterium]|nr:hypothetical protein [Actinomycetota bacterium]
MIREAVSGRTRKLVTIVGPYSNDRVDLARALIERGTAVSLCAGPPACPLLRGDDCPLLETTDATVMLPSKSQDRKVVAGISLCADRSPACVVMEPSSIGFRNGAVHVRFEQPERVAAFVTSVLHHPSSQRVAPASA